MGWYSLFRLPSATKRCSAWRTADSTNGCPSYAHHKQHNSHSDAAKQVNQLSQAVKRFAQLSGCIRVLIIVLPQSVNNRQQPADSGHT
jgi:hypothetical protein